MTPCTISFTDAAIADPTYRWDDNRNKTSEAIGGSMSGYGFSVGGSGFGEDDTYADVFSVSGNVILEETETMYADYLGLGTVVLEDSPQADLRYTLVSLTGSNDPDTGDIYAGLDLRFPRVRRG